jgi:hypothetical protein
VRPLFIVRRMRRSTGKPETVLVFGRRLLFFLDDLIPKPFDKPLLSDKPDRSLIAWH